MRFYSNPARAEAGSFVTSRFRLVEHSRRARVRSVLIASAVHGEARRWWHADLALALASIAGERGFTYIE